MALLWLGSQGNLRTQPVKAFNEDEFRGIVVNVEKKGDMDFQPVPFC